MNAEESQELASNDDKVFDNAEAIIGLAVKSFAAAAKAAVGENDRLGIPTHGSVAGKLCVRQPSTKVITPV